MATMAARARVPLVPMVKADGYGTGALAVVRALEPLEPWGYGVATVGEGVELREAGITRRILVFTPTFHEEFAEMRAARLTPVLSGEERIARWTPGGGAWHLGIDTGMARAGVRWDQIARLREVLAAHPPEGACTHFHSAELNDGSMQRQEERFRAAIAAMPRRPALLHAENGIALERRTPSAYDLARPGIFTYGVGSGDGAEVAPEPVVTVRARIADIRDLMEGESVSYGATYHAVGKRRIATLAIGYGDGYRRAFSNRGGVLIQGRPAPVVGLVTMDMTMVDVTGVPCEVGDVATLVGRDGEITLDVATVAGMGEISPYELLTGLRGRLPRVYTGLAA